MNLVGADVLVFSLDDVGLAVLALLAFLDLVEKTRYTARQLGRLFR